MKSTNGLPRWVAWPLRLALYAFVLLVCIAVAIIVVRGAKSNSADCSDASLVRDGGLTYAKSKYACLRQQTAFLENLLIYVVYQTLDVMPKSISQSIHAMATKRESPPLGLATDPDFANQLKDHIQGKLIMSGTTIYYAAKVRTKDDEDEVALTIDADPLYGLKGRPLTFNKCGGTTLYQYYLPDDAKCGPQLESRLNGSDIRVEKEGRFLNLRQAQEGWVESSSSCSSSGLVEGTIGYLDLARIRSCQEEIAKKVDAMPFESIEIYSDKALLTDVTRTTEKSRSYEYGLDENKPVTHVVVLPKNGKGPFSVEVQAVSVMHCDYEGPHVELDNWRLGLSEPKELRRDGNVFYVDANMLIQESPAFPNYTQTELREALGAYWGNKGLASLEASQSCAPALRGYRFSVKYGSELVQQISINMPLGC